MKKTIVGTVKVAGLSVDIDITVDNMCYDPCDIAAPVEKEEPAEKETKKKETKKEKKSEKKKEEKPEKDNPAVNADQVTEAAVRIAELDAKHLTAVKEAIRGFSELGVPKIKTVPVEKLGDLLEALNNLVDEIL